MEPLRSICIGDLEIRPNEHAVRVLGKEVQLTVREFDIVATLAEHPGWTYSASQLAGDPDEEGYSPESVSVLVSRLRKKLARAGASAVVDTVRGIGYRLHSSSATCEGELPPGNEADRELRDALWQLQEAVIEVERVGDEEREREVSDLLERARRAVDASLEE